MSFFARDNLGQALLVQKCPWTSPEAKLVEAGAPDVLIGESVGSCTDLSATVLQPLKQFYQDRFQVAPFSVLVDVNQVRTLERLRKSFHNADSPHFPETVMYIYEKQLEEADLIVLNKADLLSSDEVAEVEATLKHDFSQAPVITISALQGTGIAPWLDYVLQGTAAGRTITEVDYDEFAEGEAASGWLNAAIRLHTNSGVDRKAFCIAVIKAMQRKFQESSSEIAHLKLHLTAGPSTLAANLTSNAGEPLVRGEVEGAPAEAILLLNARAKIDPLQLRDITEHCISEAAGEGVRTTTEDMQSFAPSRPKSTRRFRNIV